MINRRRTIAPAFVFSPIFVHDTFTAPDNTLLTDHVGETGASWTLHPDSAGVSPVISGGEVHYGDMLGARFAYASGIPSSADYTVSADFRVDGTPDNTYAGLYARLSTTDLSGYLVQMEHYSGSWTYTLYTVVTGSYTASDVTSTDSSSTNLTIEVSGSSISVIKGGVTILSTTNSDITGANRAGLRFDKGSSADGIMIDNLIATTL